LSREEDVIIKKKYTGEDSTIHTISRAGGSKKDNRYGVHHRIIVIICFRVFMTNTTTTITITITTITTIATTSTTITNNNNNNNNIFRI